MDTNLIDWKTKLVKIDNYVCEESEESLQYKLHRFSNNDRRGPTDQKTATIYLFVM